MMLISVSRNPDQISMARSSSNRTLIRFSNREIQTYQKQKGLETLEMASLLFSAIILLILFNLASALHRKIPTTLDGPFEPVVVPFDQSLRRNAIDLPDSDPRVRRRVKGFEPEQISLALSATYDSIWISWITDSGTKWCIRKLAGLNGLPFYHIGFTATHGTSSRICGKTSGWTTGLKILAQFCFRKYNKKSCS